MQKRADAKKPIKNYRKNYAESPQVLHEEPQSVPLRTFPEVRFFAGKLRQEIPIINNRTSNILNIRTTLNTSPFDLTRSFPLFRVLTFVLGRGGAPPVFAVEPTASGRELLGRDYVEGSGREREEYVASNWDVGVGVSGGATVENRSTTITSSASVGYG